MVDLKIFQYLIFNYFKKKNKLLLIWKKYLDNFNKNEASIQKCVKNIKNKFQFCKHSLINIASGKNQYLIKTNLSFIILSGKYRRSLMFRNFKQLHEALPKHIRIYNSLSHRMPHNAYPASALNQVHYEHIEPKTFKDKIAYKCIKFIRSSYDWLTKYDPDKMTQKKWISRCMFLETVAGVPGMVGGMARHLRSLRTMKRDNGWIHHLIEQADNERFHLMIFLNLKKPTIIERMMIITLQGIFMNSFFISYLLNPKFCHRFVGYLEEQAVKTYSKILEDIENPNGSLHHWKNMPAPKQTILYYQLDEKATFKQVIMSIRADQACHRQTNHFFADIDPDFDIAQQKTRVNNQQKILFKDKNEQDQKPGNNQKKA